MRIVYRDGWSETFPAGWTIIRVEKRAYVCDPRGRHLIRLSGEVAEVYAL